MRKTLYSLIAVVLILLLAWSLLPEPTRQGLSSRLGLSAFLLNESAIASVAGEDYSLAVTRWSEAVGKAPRRSELIYNLGLGYQLLNKGEEAFKTYGLIQRDPSVPSSLQFYSHFNSGVIAQADEQNPNVEMALKEYQAALDLVPDSRETKINIELLIKNSQQQKSGQGGQGNSQKEQKEGEGEGEGKDQQDPNKPKQYAENKPQPKQFKSEQLTPNDVNKILGELKQQEQKIRNEFNKREVKEQPRDKDW